MPDTFARIAETVEALVARGIKPCAIGGGHSITWQRAGEGGALTPAASWAGRGPG